MPKRIFNYFWQARRQFVRYALVGGSGTVLDIGTLFLFKEFAGLNPVAAVALNQIIVIAYLFLFYRHWSFGGQNGAAHWQLFKFCLLLSWNYLFAVGWMWFLSQILGVNYLLARLFGIALTVSWNFVLYRHWVFVDKTVSRPLDNF